MHTGREMRRLETGTESAEEIDIQIEKTREAFRVGGLCGGGACRSLVFPPQ